MHDYRVFGRRPFFGPWPFLGGLLGGVLGSALLYPRPFYPGPFTPFGYPSYYSGYPYYW